MQWKYQGWHPAVSGYGHMVCADQRAKKKLGGSLQNYPALQIIIPWTYPWYI